VTWRDAQPPAGERDPERLGPTVDKVARRLGAPTAAALSGLFGRWDEIVGEAIAAHAQPSALRDGRLIVTVDETAWAAQLRYMGEELVSRCCEVLGPDAVRRIEIRVGRVER
jgi:predicted nucleic acid-binding Zn ribbon protein